MNPLEMQPKNAGEGYLTERMICVISALCVNLRGFPIGRDEGIGLIAVENEKTVEHSEGIERGLLVNEITLSPIKGPCSRGNMRCTVGY